MIGKQLLLTAVARKLRWRRKVWLKIAPLIPGKNSKMTFSHFFLFCLIISRWISHLCFFLSLCVSKYLFRYICTLSFSCRSLCTTLTALLSFLMLIYRLLSLYLSSLSLSSTPPPLFISADIFSPVTSDTNCTDYIILVANLLPAGNKAWLKPAH